MDPDNRSGRHHVSGNRKPRRFAVNVRDVTLAYYASLCLLQRCERRVDRPYRCESGMLCMGPGGERSSAEFGNTRRQPVGVSCFVLLHYCGINRLLPRAPLLSFSLVRGETRAVPPGRKDRK